MWWEGMALGLLVVVGLRVHGRRRHGGGIHSFLVAVEYFDNVVLRHGVKESLYGAQVVVEVACVVCWRL